MTSKLKMLFWHQSSFWMCQINPKKYCKSTIQPMLWSMTSITKHYLGKAQPLKKSQNPKYNPTFPNVLRIEILILVFKYHLRGAWPLRKDSKSKIQPNIFEHQESRSTPFVVPTHIWKNPTIENKRQNPKFTPTFFNVTRAQISFLALTHLLKGAQSMKRIQNSKFKITYFNVIRANVPFLAPRHPLEKLNHWKKSKFKTYIFQCYKDWGTCHTCCDQCCIVRKFWDHYWSHC
jgi:hypothetical protein